MTASACNGGSAQWQSAANKNANGAQSPPTQASTVDQCLAYCLANPLCVGLDISSYLSSPVYCWFHTNINDFNSLTDQAGTINYLLLSRCGSTGM